ARPGAINVIPGEAHCTLDIRHEHDPVRAGALDTLLADARRFAGERGVTLTVTHKMAQQAVAEGGRDARRDAVPALPERPESPSGRDGRTR
ncbi:Zn-dependent hydrolase, partial [Deinococcus sp. 23YEL01]|nr:Zn-dependent hydrolase [Deinococcus sp. 23YEL01]